MRFAPRQPRAEGGRGYDVASRRFPNATCRGSLFNREEKLLKNLKKRLSFLKTEDILGKTEISFSRDEISFRQTEIIFLRDDLILAGTEDIFPRREIIFHGDDDIFRKSEVGRMVYGVIFWRGVDMEGRLVEAF